jgi:FkbH-like protein
MGCADCGRRPGDAAPESAFNVFALPAPERETALILRRSSFIQPVPVGEGRVLLIHAISQLRLVVDAEVAAIIDYFATPRTLPDEYAGLAVLVPYDNETLIGALAQLTEREILTQTTPDEELAAVGAALTPTHGRDPDAMLEQYRRERKAGPDPYWSAGSALAVEDLEPGGRRVDALLFGDCDIQMESDFLRREGARRGLDLRVAATFPDDLRFAAEKPHDVILIGALRARHLIVGDPDPSGQVPPYAAFIGQARAILEQLRAVTAAPILIDNLPEPTVQPLGLAERGLNGHRTRFRLANAALADRAEGFPDVHVVDVAATLAAAGSERMIDDGQVGFTHFGSPGWMLQRPESEKAAVFGLFPDMAPLADQVGGDAYLRERVMSRAHLDAAVAVLGIDRKKVVILDLDGTMWPGVLAETGAPFAWSPEISGPFSHVGLFFGFHEALLCLKRRGVLLACVSKNDEATVRELWRYPEHYPLSRLVSFDDLVAWRINWTDKVENIRSLAEELGFPLEAFLFIDDNPVERDRVRQRLPEVEVWGDNPFDLRRRLLEDPRLQTPRITGEAAVRTDLVKAQLGRARAKAEVGEDDYLASLNLQHRIARLSPGDALDRVEELFQRTTQFNTTGRKFGVAELEAGMVRGDTAVFSIGVSDRFGDHGLVGACVVEHGEITGFAMSCRVLGLGVEHRFLQAVLDALAHDHAALSARIVETPRNAPVRNLYRDNSFARGEDGLWRLSLAGRKGTEPEALRA